MRAFFEEYGGVIFLIVFFMALIGGLVSIISQAATETGLFA